MADETKPFGPERLKELAEQWAEADAELGHSETDKLMENELVALGYGEAIAVIRATIRWYA